MYNNVKRHFGRRFIGSCRTSLVSLTQRHEISVPARFFIIGTKNDYSYNRPTVKPVHGHRNSEEEGALCAEEECFNGGVQLRGLSTAHDAMTVPASTYSRLHHVEFTPLHKHSSNVSSPALYTRIAGVD